MKNDRNRAQVPTMAMVRQRIQGYQQDCDAVALEMNETAANFKTTFRMPCPVYLSVQKLSSGSMYLRWRQAGVRGKQPYILMEGQPGAVLLSTMTPEVRKTYFHFHHQVIYLNSQHALLLAEQRRWIFYLQQRQVLEQLKNQFKAG